MSGFTTKYAIPVLLAGDPVAQAPTLMAALANRVDLLLGESSAFAIGSLAANTNHDAPISLARTYPGDVGAVPPGIVVIQYQGQVTTPLMHWVDTWTGTSTTITGFTIHTRSTASVSSRTVLWRFFPVL